MAWVGLLPCQQALRLSLAYHSIGLEAMNKSQDKRSKSVNQSALGLEILRYFTTYFRPSQQQRKCLYLISDQEQTHSLFQTKIVESIRFFRPMNSSESIFFRTSRILRACITENHPSPPLPGNKLYSKEIIAHDRKTKSLTLLFQI